MKGYFGYIRVSTARQGEHGVSLQEQRDAILAYAQRGGLAIEDWFEERETAAKLGRPVFTRMMKLLKQGRARGVIIHKIDRSARNLKDWSDLGELIDQGIEVHFANESLDLHSRGGRLSADIQAVVAADYIRNLREETRKGLYGRLKQGIYPFPAPIGYLDQGGGKPKAPDPALAPYIRQTFELYATGRHSLASLAQTMAGLGMRSRTGAKLHRNSLALILSNPFYMGLIRLRRSGQTIEGIHEPLVSPVLFGRVQAILSGKGHLSSARHDLLYRRLLTCGRCGYALNGEVKKGHVYYRCHSKSCAGTCLREEVVEAQVLKTLATVQFSAEEKAYLQAQVACLREDWTAQRERQVEALKLQIGQASERLTRLTDAFLDGALERELFEERKTALLMERKRLEENLAGLDTPGQQLPERLADFLELASNVYLGYKTGLPAEKRELLKIVTSNRRVERKNVVVELSPPFAEVARRSFLHDGSPQRDTPRTLSSLVHYLVSWLSDNHSQGFQEVLQRACRPQKQHPKPLPLSQKDLNKVLPEQPADEEDDYPWVKMAG